MRLLKEFFGAPGRKSLWVARFDCGGCNGCAAEALVALIPLFDAQRFGVSEVQDPRLADVLLVTGAPGPGTADGLRAAFDLMPAPATVMAVGDCALNGAPLGQVAEEGGVGAALSVRVRVAGCPPRPEAVLEGVLQALEPLASLETGPQAS